MADNYVGKLLTELTEKTTATDTDLVPVAEKTGNLFRMTLAKLKEFLLGTKDISGIGDGTVKGAINELNTNLLLKNISIGGIQDFVQTPRNLLGSVGGSLSKNGSVVADFSYFLADNSNKTSNSPFVGTYPEWYNVITFGYPTRCSQIAISCYQGRQSIWIRYQHDDIVSGWTKLG